MERRLVRGSYVVRRAGLLGGGRVRCVECQGKSLFDLRTDGNLPAVLLPFS